MVLQSRPDKTLIMFEYQPRRHPLQSFQFWFTILVCAVGVFVWRSGVLTQNSQAVVITPTIEEEDMPLPPQAEEEFSTDDSSSTLADVTLAPLQSEEPFSEQRSTEDAHFPNGETMSDDQLKTADGVHDGDPNNESLTVQRTSLESPSADSSIQSPSLGFGEALTSRQVTPQALDFTEIDRQIAVGDDVAALRALSTLYWQHPEKRRQLATRLDQLSRRVYFQQLPHYVDPYEVQFGDRMETIAKKYQVSWNYLAKINHVDPQRIRAGQKLKVIQGPFDVVVDLSDFELTVHAHGYFVVRMPVGIGQDESTPIGTFRVTDKVVDPIYYGPDGVIKNDDPANPLGERWLAISDAAGTVQGYGLHGTIDPSSIGKAESRGCIRLYDQDVADLYDLLTIGSKVIIRR